MESCVVDEFNSFFTFFLLIGLLPTQGRRGGLVNSAAASYSNKKVHGLNHGRLEGLSLWSVDPIRAWVKEKSKNRL